MRALRASLESIKQVVQGVHNDLLTSQTNYKEISGPPSSQHHHNTANLLDLQTKWTGIVDQIEQENNNNNKSR